MYFDGLTILRMRYQNPSKTWNPIGTHKRISVNLDKNGTKTKARFRINRPIMTNPSNICSTRDSHLKRGTPYRYTPAIPWIKKKNIKRTFKVEINPAGKFKPALVLNSGSTRGNKKATNVNHPKRRLNLAILALTVAKR